MEIRIPGQAEQPPERHLERIAEADYDGACLDPNTSEIEACLKLKPLFEDLGLKCMINAFPHDLHSLKPLLEMADELNATQVNIIGGVMPRTVNEAIPVIEKWLDQAKTFPFPVLFETHRNSTLNDLFYTLEVLAMVPELRLCADLSHFVLDRELQIPLNKADANHFSQIIERSDSFQGRISSNQQIQIPLDFCQNALWVEQFLSWWKEGFEAWSLRNSEKAILRFLVELGPPPYALTDAAQRELSDRWDEGMLIRQWIRAIWSEMMKAKSIGVEDHFMTS